MHRALRPAHPPLFACIAALAALSSACRDTSLPDWANPPLDAGPDTEGAAPEAPEGVFEATLEISDTGASGGATPPFPLGTRLRARYDTNRDGALIVGEDEPTFDREEGSGEGTRRLYTRTESDVAWTYQLALDAEGEPTRLTIETLDLESDATGRSAARWPR